MTDKTVTQAELLPCPICHSTDIIGGEHEGACVYCKKCWLRGVSPAAWNTRQTDAQMAAPDGLAGQLVALRESEAIEIAEFVWQNFDTILASLSASNAMRDALEKNREGWLNAIEMGLLPKQHYETARILADECLAALAGQGTTQKDTSHG